MVILFLISVADGNVLTAQPQQGYCAVALAHTLTWRAAVYSASCEHQALNVTTSEVGQESPLCFHRSLG